MAIKRYLVTVDGQIQTRVAEVAAALEAVGFEVGDVFDAIGVITGRLDETAVALVRALKGVGAIEEDGPVTAQDA